MSGPLSLHASFVSSICLSCRISLAFFTYIALNDIFHSFSVFLHFTRWSSEDRTQIYTYVWLKSNTKSNSNRTRSGRALVTRSVPSAAQSESLVHSEYQPRCLEVIEVATVLLVKASITFLEAEGEAGAEAGEEEEDEDEDEAVLRLPGLSNNEMM